MAAGFPAAGVTKAMKLRDSPAKELVPDTERARDWNNRCAVISGVLQSKTFCFAKLQQWIQGPERGDSP
jgi:hypothetical protein